jgi:hypothetical protein
MDCGRCKIAAISTSVFIFLLLLMFVGQRKGIFAFSRCHGKQDAVCGYESNEKCGILNFS